MICASSVVVTGDGVESNEETETERVGVDEADEAREGTGVRGTIVDAKI